MSGPLEDRRGATNGIHRSDWRSKLPRRENPFRKPKPWTATGIAIWSAILLVVIIVSTIAVEASLPNVNEPVRVDGDASEWPWQLTVPLQVPYAMLVSSRAIYLRFPAVVLQGDRGLMDALLVYADTDADPNTGYVVHGIGADVRISIQGSRGKVQDARLCTWQRAGDWWDPNGFGGCGGLLAAQGKGGIEFGFMRWSLGDVDPYGIAWAAETHPVSGDVKWSGWGHAVKPWRERDASPTWRDAIRIDGSFLDWQTADHVVTGYADVDLGNREDLWSLSRVISEWNSSFLVTMYPFGMDGNALPYPNDRIPVVLQTVPASKPGPVMSFKPPLPFRFDTVELRFNQSTVQIKGYAGHVINATITDRENRTTLIPAAFVKGKLELQLPGLSWLGNVTVLSHDWDWKQYDAFQVGPLGGPNPPTIQDIGGNIVNYFRNTPHATETDCNAINYVTSTAQGASVVTVNLNSLNRAACWYDDSTTGTTIVAGDWETLMDIANYAPPGFSKGTLAGDPDPHTDLTVTLPSYAADDILLLYGATRDKDETASATGYTAITGSPFDTSTSRNWYWWKRAAASESDPVIVFSGTTGDAYGQVARYRSLWAGGDPWEVIGTWGSTGTNPLSLTGITTLTDNALVVVPSMYEDNDLAGCTVSSTNPASYTTHYTETTLGDDWAVCFAEALRTTNGATGTVSVDWGGTLTDQSGGIVLSALSSLRYDVRIEVWNKATDSIDSTIGTCDNEREVGDDVRCLISGVAETTLSANQVIRVKVILTSTTGGIIISYNDADTTGDSRYTYPGIPEFASILVPVGGVLLLFFAIPRLEARRRKTASERP